MSSPLPRLSVVIPNYNHARYLPTCLGAVLRQSVQPFEVIVIDDASTDNSVEVIEQFAREHPIVRLHRNEKNRGVVFNMNKGLLELAQGDYVYMAAADDEVQPGHFEKTLSLLAQHPQAALCCTIGDWREIETGLNWHVGVGMGDQPCFISPQEMARLERAGKLFIASNSAVFNRRTLNEVGGFVPELRWHCDWFAIYTSGFRHGVCFVPEPLAVANIHATSFYSVGSKQDEHRRVLERMLELLNSSAYADVMPFIRDSGALFLFGRPMFKLMRSRPEFRHFLTPTFLRKNLWHTFKVDMKRIAPAWVGNLYIKLTGQRAKKRD
ncbi:MAG: glycosyltransferase family 2 protein [Verrucomicrobiota bacterium]